MCIAFIRLHPTSQLRLLIAFNRDEFLERPTESVHCWEDPSGIIGGRDIVNGGTWLGITRSGRFAFVTNFREEHFDSVKDAESRGALPTEFLVGQETPLQYANSLNLEDYNGFNLTVGDLSDSTIAQISNRATQPTARCLDSDGLVHGLSNGPLHSNWPKVTKGAAAITALLGSCDASLSRLPLYAILEVLRDTSRPSPDDIPHTGVAPEIDEVCSPVFIPPLVLSGADYGTRSQTVIAVWSSGSIEVDEWSLNTVVEPAGVCVQRQWTHSRLKSSVSISLQGVQ